MKRFILVGSVLMFSLVLLSANAWADSGKKATEAGLAAETAARIAGDTALQNSVDEEKADRAEGDAGLRNQINTEEGARIAGDSGLQSQIESEKAERVAAGTALQIQIDKIELTPGPRGEKGDKGEQGIPGADGTEDIEVLEALCNIYKHLRLEPYPEVCMPCGNNVKELLEECDGTDGVPPGFGCSECKLTGCGNGILESPEQCDDGNEDELDGCTSDCKVPNIDDLCMIDVTAELWLAVLGRMAEYHSDSLTECFNPYACIGFKVGGWPCVMGNQTWSSKDDGVFCVEGQPRIKNGFPWCEGTMPWPFDAQIDSLGTWTTVQHEACVEALKQQRDNDLHDRRGAYEREAAQCGD